MEEQVRICRYIDEVIFGLSKHSKASIVDEEGQRGWKKELSGGLGLGSFKLS